MARPTGSRRKKDTRKRRQRKPDTDIVSADPFGDDPSFNGLAPEIWTTEQLDAHARWQWKQHTQELPSDDDDQNNDGLFRRWTIQELMSDADKPMVWDIYGVWAHGSYGPIAGMMKTLKTHIAGFIAICMASGTPLFDIFKVSAPGPVVRYVAEGGRTPDARRLQRIARALDVKLDHLPIHSIYESAALGSERFMESLKRDLKEVQPTLFQLDPLYSYQGGNEVRSSDLYSRGEALTRFVEPCLEANVSTQVIDHWNQTGSGRGLDRLTQAGMGEWADSWIMLSHRQPPDVMSGLFWLRMEIGSRQWGGTMWDLDMNLGRFNMETSQNEGEISWEIRPRVAAVSSGEGGDLKSLIMEYLELNPGKSKTQIARGIHKRKEDVFKVVDQMFEDDILREVIGGYELASSRNGSL